MNNNTPPGFPQFDPSKMDPKALMEMSALFQQLDPQQMSKMQTLMHNMMAGYDIRKEMEDFEKSLPPGFREKLLSMMGASGMGMGLGMGMGMPPASSEISAMGASTIEVPASSGPSDKDMDVHQARITILRAVHDGRMTPEEAEKLLFA